MIDTEVIHQTVDRGAHTVLVVDDNPATRYSTSRVLRAGGFRVAEAASGQEAIHKADTSVSAVVLDVHLPDVDGFEVCRRIRADGRTELLPVMHLSATHVRAEDRVAGLNAGADAYLVHPVEPAVLIATVQALIRARLAEQQQRQSEQRFRAIYDQAQGGICMLDAQGRFEDANPSMLRMLARERADVLGRTVRDFIAADSPDALAAALEFESAGARPWHGEFPLLAADGRRLYLEWNVSAAMERGSRIATVVDASERHELEERRRELLEREQSARAAAERHSRTKDDFIAVLSHELRNPLNSIAGWVAVLMRRQPTPETLKGLEAIDRNVKTQARIISDILDVSRINSGKMRLEIEEVDPVELVRNSLSSLTAAIDEKALDVVQDFESAGGAAWLDPSRFQQIFWNLMTNAIKFSQRGGKVLVMLRRDGERLRLVVRDHGQGIDADFLPHLFDRFTQSDAPDNRRHGGLGLGLSIVKQLAELHGGSVAAQSGGAGQGTTMAVELPVELPVGLRAGTRGEPGADADGDDTGPGELEAEAVPLPLEGLNVLVVEDDAGAREMLEVVLSDRGAKVTAAHDFDSAVAEAASRWPHVLVSDIGLPQRDGYELIRRLRTMQPPGQPLAAVALTAFARETDREKALSAGFDAHVEKPLKPHALVKAILEVTVGWRQSQR
ncbi:response regulator [Ramlibacter sp.]|uniref:hybrid sensor histidine kinase/response regulator n=1 Tax=Ramlibacter sp. TaxID=1917967 RepID=UPI003D0C52BF